MTKRSAELRVTKLRLNTQTKHSLNIPGPLQLYLLPEALKTSFTHEPRAHERFETNLTCPLAHEGFVYYVLVIVP